MDERGAKTREKDDKYNRYYEDCWQAHRPPGFVERK